jgi:hypothetical protein
MISCMAFFVRFTTLSWLKKSSVASTDSCQQAGTRLASTWVAPLGSQLVQQQVLPGDGRALMSQPPLVV